MSTTVNTARKHFETALLNACADFGRELASSLGENCPDDFENHISRTLQAYAEMMGREVPKPKAKKKTTSGPSKKQLKIAAKLDELAQLGGVAPEENTLKAVNTAISQRKKAIKAEEKAAKVQAKKETKMKAAAEKKASKKASPKSKDITQRRLKASDGSDILGENGSFLRVAIHKETRVATKVKEENWTDEANARYAVLFPEGKDVKKAKIVKKKPAAAPKKAKITKKPKEKAEAKLQAEQQALIAAMVSDAASDELTEKTVIPVTKATPVSEETQDSNLPKAVPAPKVEAEEAEEAEEEDAEDDEDDELEELDEEEMVEEDEEETPDFPGEENIEEFSHEALKVYADKIEDFYVDEESNVWDENMTFVGKYDTENDVVAIQADYEPEE
tara:strand:+ start:501 stop:1670 length:1170 start_codon:yes stop_codon:yes gene_type:complete